MKIVLMLVFVLAALATNAQPTNTTPAPALETHISRRLSTAMNRISTETKPNEIVKGNIAYSGLTVEVAKLGNPLQLFNPFAPAKYGSPEDNLLPDRYNGRNLGWKIFSLSF